MCTKMSAGHRRAQLQHASGERLRHRPGAGGGVFSGFLSGSVRAFLDIPSILSGATRKGTIIGTLKGALKGIALIGTLTGKQSQPKPLQP